MSCINLPCFKLLDIDFTSIASFIYIKDIIDGMFLGKRFLTLFINFEYSLQFLTENKSGVTINSDSTLLHFCFITIITVNKVKSFNKKVCSGSIF